MVFTRRSTRIPSRIFASGSTPIRTRQEQGKTMPKKLEGKVAVITGGTEGIGLATAKLFVKEGAYVFITGRRQKELDEAVKAIGSNVSGVQGDIAQLADLDRLYETVSKLKGRIDKGTLFTVQKALPLLNDGGSIIMMVARSSSTA